MRCVSLLLIFLVFLVPINAPAETSESAHATFAAGPPVRSQLEEVLRELLGRLGVTLTCSSAHSIDLDEVMFGAPSRTNIVLIWIDTSNSMQVSIFLRDERRQRILVRHVPLEGGFDEVAREQVAHIIASSVDAILSGASIGIPREAAQVEVQARAPTTDAQPISFVAAIGLDYSGEIWSVALPLRHGPGIELFFDAGREAARFGFWLAIDYRTAGELHTHPLGLRLRSIDISLLATAAFPLRRGWTLRTGLGAALNLSYLDPLVLEPEGAVADPARFTAIPLLLGALRFEYQRRFLITYFGIQAEVDLVDARYYINRDGQLEVIFDPWRWRAGFLLGLAIDIPSHSRGRPRNVPHQG